MRRLTLRWYHLIWQHRHINTKSNLMKDICVLKNDDIRTVIFVTHDLEEATILGDNIIILSDKPATVIKTIRNTISGEKRWNKNNEFKLMIQVIKKELATHKL